MITDEHLERLDKLSVGKSYNITYNRYGIDMKRNAPWREWNVWLAKVGTMFGKTLTSCIDQIETDLRKRGKLPPEDSLPLPAELGEIEEEVA